jgi:hypothetical protein
MLTIAAVFVISGVVLGIVTKRSKSETGFALICILPATLFAGCFLGLEINSNSVALYIGFVLSFFLSLMATALGMGLIVVRVRTRAPVRKQVLLSLLASSPILCAILKRCF